MCSRYLGYEIRRELERAKRSVKDAHHIDNPTDIQVYRWLLNNFDARLPFDSYWHEAELEGNLDKELGTTSMFCGSEASRQLLSRICRDFFLEVGDAVKIAGVPSDLIDVTSYEEAYERHKLVRRNFVPQLYAAYVSLRKKGYNYVDLIA